MARTGPWQSRTHRPCTTSSIRGLEQLDFAIVLSWAWRSWHVVEPGMNMPADCLTKRLGNRTLLRLIMRIDKYAITEAGSDKLWETPLDGCEMNDHEPQNSV